MSDSDKTVPNSHQFSVQLRPGHERQLLDPGKESSDMACFYRPRVFAYQALPLDGRSDFSYEIVLRDNLLGVLWQALLGRQWRREKQLLDSL